MLTGSVPLLKQQQQYTNDHCVRHLTLLLPLLLLLPLRLLQAGNKSMLAYRSDIGIPGYTGKCCCLLCRAEAPPAHNIIPYPSHLLPACMLTHRLLPRLEHCACAHQRQQQAHGAAAT